MKSKQLGYVLMALIVVGIAGLVIRVTARTGPEDTLAGLVQVSGGTLGAPPEPSLGPDLKSHIITNSHPPPNA